MKINDRLLLFVGHYQQCSRVGDPNM